MNSPEIKHQELRECDGCGKGKRYFTRKHRGMLFCATCYKRLFKRMKCPQCGSQGRIYSKDENAVCIRCERDKPCVRCGKSSYEIGKLTPYGPACNSCSVHFREEKKCERCGAFSKRLSRYPKYGINESICPKCANAIRGNCESCRRNRILEISDDGKKLCSKCRDQGNISCPSCGKKYPAGYGNRCEDCYYRNLLSRKTAINLEAIESEEIKSLLSHYSTWLVREYKAKKASYVINRHFKFFAEVDSKWGHLPDYKDLLHYFSAEGLRHFRTVIRFLSETNQIEVNESMKNTDSEWRRIESIVQEFERTTPEGRIIKEYSVRLRELLEQNSIKINTVRVYLRAAANLIHSSKSVPPAQTDVDQYILSAPGQKASLNKFISYLNETHGSDRLFSPNAPKTAKQHSKRMEKKLIRLLEDAGNEASYSNPEILAAALGYYHGLKITSTVADQLTTSDTDGGIIVMINNREYWLPQVDLRFLGLDP